MRAMHRSNMDFNIDAAGKITRKSTWNILPDSDVLNDWPAFAEAARAWAGKIGDPWRIPTENSQGYTEDPDYVITEIGFTSEARFIYNVEYQGQRKYTTAEQVGGVDIEINENDERTKTAHWMVHADNLDNWLPKLGEVIVWLPNVANTLDDKTSCIYMVSEISCTGAASGIYEVTVKAKDMSVLMIGNPTYRCTSAKEQTRSAKWRVSNSAYDSFMAAHAINSDASSWAGTGYYVTNVEAEAVGKIGYIVTLEVKHIGVRVIDIRDTSEFKGYLSDGGTSVSTTFYGRWQVHKDSLAEFKASNAVGTSASDWTEKEGYIITRYDPVKVSDMEYEISLTAACPDETSAGFAPLTVDPRDDIKKGKVVISTSQAERYIRMEEAGYIISKATGLPISLNALLKSKSTDAIRGNKSNKGKYYEDDDLKSFTAWVPATDCPFLISADAMAKQFVEAAVPVTAATLCRYYKGEPAAQMAQLRRTIATRVINGELPGIGSGSWLLAETPKMERVQNKDGTIWTRFESTYLLSPFDNVKWNPAYHPTNAV